MQAIILAGGFARRLWPITRSVPKPLLPVGGKPIISYIVDDLRGSPQIEKIFVTTNSKFKRHFESWQSQNGFEVHVAEEPSSSEKDKLGAIGAISHLVKEQRIDDDVLVIGGDNIFTENITRILQVFYKRNTSVIGLFDIGDKEKAAGRFGVVELDHDGVVTSFEEKPESPKGSLVSTLCYVLKKEDLRLIHDYVENNEDIDAPGRFIRWVSERKKVVGHVFSGEWHDIGHIDAYCEANEKLTRD